MGWLEKLRLILKSILDNDLNERVPHAVLIGIRRGVSKWVEEGRRLISLRASHP
jgi:hypothetical protein